MFFDFNIKCNQVGARSASVSGQLTGILCIKQVSVLIVNRMLSSVFLRVYRSICTLWFIRVV